jgi:hypothetical protein
MLLYGIVLQAKDMIDAFKVSCYECMTCWYHQPILVGFQCMIR